MTEGMEVRRNDAERRYEIVVDGEVAGHTVIIPQGDGVLLFPHTEIDEKYAGRGLANSLVTAALDDVRARGERIVVTCPYILPWLEKHPDYKDLLA